MSSAAHSKSHAAPPAGTGIGGGRSRRGGTNAHAVARSRSHRSRWPSPPRRPRNHACKTIGDGRAEGSSSRLERRGKGRGGIPFLEPAANQNHRYGAEIERMALCLERCVVLLFNLFAPVVGLGPFCCPRPLLPRDQFLLAHVS